MVNLDSQIIVNEIEYYGEDITISQVATTIDNRGDPTEVVTDNTGVKAMINFLERGDDYITEGIARMGDVSFFIKGDEDYVSRGNRITYGDDTYEIVEAFPGTTAGVVYIYEVIARKV